MGLFVQANVDGSRLIEVNHNRLFARMDGLVGAFSSLQGNLSLAPSAGRLRFTTAAPTVFTAAVDAMDPRRITLELVAGLASHARVAVVRGLLDDHTVPPDYLASVEDVDGAVLLVLLHPSDSTDGPRLVRGIGWPSRHGEDEWTSVKLRPQGWPTRDRDLPRDQPTSQE